MKQFYKALLLPWLVSLGALAPPAALAQSRLLLRTDSAAVNPGWTEVARDEFYGHTLNPHYWQTHPVEGSDYGWGCEQYDASMVTVSNGAAHLMAKRVSKTTLPDGRLVRYSSGMLCSTANSPFRTTGNASYGAYEARLKLPSVAVQ